ncbi:Metalloprotease mig-17, partial [Biomphalaria glabrata]
PELRSSLDAEFLKKFQGGARGNRRRRQSLSTYYIDITAFLDYTAYSRFLAKASYDADVAMQKIQEYFSFIFAG